MYTFYCMGLIGISVGGVRVPGVTESDLRLCWDMDIWAAKA